MLHSCISYHQGHALRTAAEPRWLRLNRLWRCNSTGLSVVSTEFPECVNQLVDDVSSVWCSIVGGMIWRLEGDEL